MATYVEIREVLEYVGTRDKVEEMIELGSCNWTWGFYWKDQHPVAQKLQYTKKNEHQSVSFGGDFRSLITRQKFHNLVVLSTCQQTMLTITRGHIQNVGLQMGGGVPDSRCRESEVRSVKETQSLDGELTLVMRLGKGPTIMYRSHVEHYCHRGTCQLF